MNVTLHRGDCLAVLRTMPDASINAVVCDPPYGLAAHRPDVVTAAMVAWAQGDRERVPDGRGFMGRAWDGFVPPPAVWDECLRVLKPGGHLVAFAGSRTYDLMGLSIRLAGFEVRDGLQWLYGAGMPKGINVSKAIDATLTHGGSNSRRMKATNESRPGEGRMGTGLPNAGVMSGQISPPRVTRDEPATAEAAHWQGWNTSLKPAHEPIVLARKPLAGTVAATVLAHGTGALNIDGCRVPGAKPDTTRGASVKRSSMEGGALGGQGRIVDDGAGRWPSNVLLGHGEGCGDVCQPGCPVVELDAQSGTRPAGSFPARTGTREVFGGLDGYEDPKGARSMGDTGGASRFFPTFRYQAKAPARERPKVDGVAHPTVKPLALMAWLVRLVTPPGGVVLDPFAGSGTTLQAARDEGFAAIGVESFPDYWPLIRHRLGGELDEVDAPVVEPVPVEPAPVLDPVLAEVAAAGSDEELTRVWERHAQVWGEAHTAAARERLAQLVVAA